jgi:dipeptidyl aminopeptidase/acylaminoacyl peptidase
MTRRIGQVVFACIAASLTPVALHAAEKRSITEKDILQFKWIGDPQVSPDGSRVAFVRVVVNEDKDRYETSLFVVPAKGSAGPRPFTSGPFDTSPRWSPDGRTLAFVRAVEKEGGKSGKAQIYLLSADGGEARALTELAKGAGAPHWSPDGATIAFTTSTLPGDTPEEDPKKSDVRVITRAVYRSNGGGYYEPDRRDHIWAVPASFDATGERPLPYQVTVGNFDEENIAWSPDGARIYFTSTRVLEPYYTPSDADLYAIPSKGGDMVQIASIDGEIEAFRPSPDGKRIVFIGTLNAAPLRSYNQPDLFVTDTMPESTPRNLTADYDFDLGGGISGDQRAPRGGRGGGIIWNRDGKSVLVTTTAQGRANLQRIRLTDGRIEAFTSGNQDVIAQSASADGSTLVALVSTASNVGDLFVADARKKAAELKQLTRVNDAPFAGLDITEPEEIWYDSFDGTKIHGWILKPPGFDASKKYPMILEVHGGPHIPYGYSFTHEFLWMAAKGYVVLYTNPRGSSSYGQDFGNLIQFAYPGDDYKDLMAGVDEVVKRGYIDEKRIGITGGSGGGVLTNWAITQTNRFAAAVSQRSIADWAGFWYTCDFSLFQPVWFRGTPWEEQDDFAARSAITHIANVTTPLMLVEGESDLRTPAGEGGEQMFRALKYLKKPVVMVRFPDETHELSRSGKPSHRVERLQHIVGWFDKYLQGKDSGAYDVR